MLQKFIEAGVNFGFKGVHIFTFIEHADEEFLRICAGGRVGCGVEEVFNQRGVEIFVFVMTHGAAAFDEGFQARRGGEVVLQRGGTRGVVAQHGNGPLRASGEAMSAAQAFFLIADRRVVVFKADD